MTKRTRDAAATRERILLAAEDIVLTDGVATLTLENAAERAGVSKGGVLYHFGTRSDLISAMVQRTAERFDAGIEDHRRDHPDCTYPQAYIAECLAPPVDEHEQRMERVGASLIAAVAAQGDLSRPLREAFAGWQSRIEDDAEDAVVATVARLAADGLWLCELFGIDALGPELRARVEDELHRMVGRP